MDDLAHANYLIGGLLLLVMVVMGVWIKFFVSWKRELDNSDYDMDVLAMNNCDPGGVHVDKDEPFRDTSEADKKETEFEENCKSKGESDTRLVNEINVALGNPISNVNNVNDVELHRL